MDAAAVLLVVGPLDEVLLLQPAQHAGDGGGVQMELVGQLRGGLDLLLPETAQQRVLGRGGVKVLEPPLEVVKNGVLGAGQHEIDTLVDFHRYDSSFS